jgi:hypothetical protein
MQRSKLRIAHLNVRSIKNRNHLIQVRELMKDRNYDILGIVRVVVKLHGDKRGSRNRGL